MAHIKALPAVKLTALSFTADFSKKRMLFNFNSPEIGASFSYADKENEYDENFFSRELKTFEALTFISTNEGILINKVIFERWK